MEGMIGGYGKPSDDLGSYERDGYTPATPSHPFTPDVVAWAKKHGKPLPEGQEDGLATKIARQICAAVGEG